MMLNLHVITGMTLSGIVLNFALPIMGGSFWSIFMVSQLLIVGGLYVYGWICSRSTQRIMITFTFLVRLLQAAVFVFWRGDLSWVAFLSLIAFDTLFLVVLAIDKMNYRYEIVSIQEDEFTDKRKWSEYSEV